MRAYANDKIQLPLLELDGDTKDKIKTGLGQVWDTCNESMKVCCALSSNVFRTQECKYSMCYWSKETENLSNVWRQFRDSLVHVVQHQLTEQWDATCEILDVKPQEKQGSVTQGSCFCFMYATNHFYGNCWVTRLNYYK